MKKALLTLMCLAAMMVASTNVKAQEVTIPLMPGWNWIGIPTTDTLDFATALGSFTPMTGDVIKTQWQNAVYRNGHWIGPISQFYPGYGYKYYSNRAMPVMVTFNVQQPAPSVVVTTTEPMLITAISAMGGGEVTVNDGTYIIVKGLCWATHENPTTNDDFYQEAESGVGSFSLSMTGLNISTTYYVRAYAVTSNGTVYGDQKTFTTRDGIPTLTTDSVVDITGVTAICGGDITDNGGLNVTARGVCWSTSPNPTVADSHTTDGTGLGSFVSAITDLTPNTTYYVRAYATNSYVTVYGNQQSFMTESGGSGVDHDYVDLGLPSGTLWATCNVGADTPEEYGNYFAWGETQPQDYYDWTTYQYCNGNNCTLTKYCYHPSYGYNGFTDNLTELLPEDDAAIAQWGSEWRMPTSEEWNELLNNTTNTWVTQNGVYGRLFTATNSNCLFLPAAGYRFGSELICAGSYGYYWSSLLSTDNPLEAWCFQFKSNDYGMIDSNRSSGQPVRAVRSGATNYSITVSAIPILGGIVTGGGTYQQGQTCTVSATANTGYTFTNWTENDEVVSTEAIYIFTVDADRTIVANFTYNGGGDHDYVDLGLPSGLLWATCNVGATNPEDYGDYFAWGETQPKDTYVWWTYQYCNGGDGWNTLTKYCDNSNFGYNGFIDNLTVLLSEDDAATVNWGEDWRMPTHDEWAELYQNTTCTWINHNGVNGCLIIATNGNSLFLPASGYRSVTELYLSGSNGLYWSSSLEYDIDPSYAWNFDFNMNDYCAYCGAPRFYGRSVRAVRSVQPSISDYSITVMPNPTVGGTVAGGGTYQQGQYCNVIAIPNNGYTFSSWTENGNVVSTGSSYSFFVNGNRSLVANFNAQSFTISVSANPSNGGSVSGGGNYNYGQTCTVHATASSGYTFTNWTINGNVVSTNANYSFTVNANRSLVANFTNNHYVDLGLPSGLLWATCNVGAGTPEGHGKYFAWGETQTKENYDWYNYTHCHGNYSKLTRYCTDSQYGYNGFTDNLTTLLSQDDAADYGGRIPTKEEWEELYNNTTCVWTTSNGVNGLLITGSNGNSLFLPAVGVIMPGSSLYDPGTLGCYWSSSLITTTPYLAWYCCFHPTGYEPMQSSLRACGIPIRAVRSN